ncbi:MAG TPA: type II toxin-antitoxin system RelE/ParE family toxin [Mesorhizobium sp.]|nr:type II toxin-antitoxin system RelE/ParE family toxin [Mesorhizobium sp.]
MRRRIVFSPEAQSDLRELYLYIAAHDGPDRAIAYVEKVEAFCRSFEEFPERGILRDDLFPGLRIVGFRRRISIAFGVSQDAVTFYRVLYGGRDLASHFSED